MKKLNWGWAVDRAPVCVLGWVVLVGQFGLNAQEPVPGRLRQQTLNRFDKDGDGKLSLTERRSAQPFLKARKSKPGDVRERDVEPFVDPETTPLYKLVDGPYETSSKMFELAPGKKGNPNKLLPVKITFPLPRIEGQNEKSKESEKNEENEKLPVIVFSHGAGGSRDGYRPLTDYWASHGYVVLQPTHGDSLSLLSRRDRQRIRLKQYVTEGGMGKYLIPRTRDIRLILDRIEDIPGEVPELKFPLDGDRIGVGGHSFGAYTTMLIGDLSLVVRGTGRRVTFSDSRPIALLMISPQGVGGPIDDRSWSGMTCPSMVVTGSNDEGIRGEPASWRLEPFRALPAEHKYLTFLEGAEHHFGGISGVAYLGAGEPNTDHVHYVRSSTLAWWDSQLKSDPAALEYLDSGQLQRVTRWVARISKTVEVKPIGPKR